MCGILTIVDKKGRALNLAACRRALSEMTWRGPDEAISLAKFNDRVFLGQTILSLTGDLSAPDTNHLCSQSGRYTIAYNGEVYNFQQLAKNKLADLPKLTAPETTDSEVLANLHDKFPRAEVPEHLDGMYAYALLDEKSETLTYCRDVQGEKSLYIFEDEEVLIVSSEIQAILTLVPRAAIDEQALRDYFRTRHLLLFDRTAFRDIRQLPPGTVAEFDLRSLRWKTLRRRSLRDWIDPARMQANAARSLDDLADELDALLAGCVKEMLPAGRKFAAVVSGGVDSSLIAHYVVHGGAPDLLIAVNHVGKDRISSDLSGFARALGAPIDTLEVDKVPYSAEIPRCQKACGSPLPSHSFVAQAMQSARVAAKGCRVLFGGDTADEVFGGYSVYAGEHRPDAAYCPSPYTSYVSPELEFAGDEPARFRDELAAAWKESLGAYGHVADPGARAALAMMYCDAAYQVPAVGLRGADLMSMMWSVEARSVYIRRPVLDFALNLPFRAKIDHAGGDELLRTKVLLKKLFVRHFGRDLLMTKQGFAGFPNESADYLGAPADYLAHRILGIMKGAGAQPLGRDAFWKLANVEYFLRGRGLT
ncbi:MAG: asparagine synthetase B [Elusimicrobiota bacterium]